MAKRGHGFFFGMSIVLLSIVLVGFARTFYLRAWFDVPPIPGHVYLHGLVLTGWFVWLCLQTWLVAAGRTDLHRRLGIVGSMLGAAVIAANVSVLASVGPRVRVVVDSGEIDPDFLVHAIWGDVLSTIAFATFFSAALLLRRRTEAHRRLMLLASFSIVGQALGRISLWPVIARIENAGFFLSAGALVLLLGSLVVYDFWTTRRLHPATMVGGAFRLILWMATGAIAASEFGQEWVRGMASAD